MTVMDSDGPSWFEVVVHLDVGRARGSLPARGFNRLTDALNSREGEFLQLYHASVSAGAGGEPLWQAAEVQLARRDILLIEPVQQVTRPDPEARVSKLVTQAGLLVGPLLVTGAVHLLGRVRPVDFLTASRDQFFPVTQVTMRASNGESTSTPFVLVNGARLTAFSELHGDALIIR